MDATGQFLASLIRSGSRAYASGALTRMQSRQPDLLTKGLPAGFANPREDTAVRLLHLAEALGVGRPELFCHQVGWYKVAFAARGVHRDYLAGNLEALEEELCEALPERGVEMARSYLAAGRRRCDEAPDELPSLLEGDHPHVDLARRFLLAILETRADTAMSLVQTALDDGVSVEEIYAHVLGRVQQEVGRMWQMAEIHTAEEHFGSRIVERCMSLVQQRMPRSPSNGRRALTAAVGGNLHDIGIRMVSDHLEMAGWTCVHLGSGIPAHDMVSALTDFEIQLVAISATMVLHVTSALDLIASIHTAFGAEVPPIIVGGAPFRIVPDLWQVVGADAMANDAMGAVEVAEELTV